MSEMQEPVEAEVPGGGNTEEKNPFRFNGSAMEFFRIWIVNVGLSIMTLGIYSAWAKVRTRKYFYGNTVLEGTSFFYDANPVAILKGRIIAFLLITLYSIIMKFLPTFSLPMMMAVPVLLMVVYAVFLPWLVMKSLRFNMRSTSYRNIRFGFDGTWLDIFIYWVVMSAAGLFTFGLILPFSQYLQKKYLIEKTRFGKTSFSTDATAGYFYVCHIIAIVVAFFIMLFLLLITGIFTPLLAGLHLSPQTLILIYYPLFIFLSLIIYLFIKVSIFNYMIGHTTLGEKKFYSSQKTMDVVKIYFSNIFLVLLSAGLLIPWAMIRIYRYRVEHLSVSKSGSLDLFEAGEDEKISALGEEIGDFFEIDISL